MFNSKIISDKPKNVIYNSIYKTLCWLKLNEPKVDELLQKRKMLYEINFSGAGKRDC